MVHLQYEGYRRCFSRSHGYILTRDINNHWKEFYVMSFKKMLSFDKNEKIGKFN